MGCGFFSFNEQFCSAGEKMEWGRSFLHLHQIVGASRTLLLFTLSDTSNLDRTIPMVQSCFAWLGPKFRALAPNLCISTHCATAGLDDISIGREAFPIRETLTFAI